MKKRMIALMLAGIMVLSVTACGGGGASSKNQNNQDDGESKQVGVEVTAGRCTCRRTGCSCNFTRYLITGYVRRMDK